MANQKVEALRDELQNLMSINMNLMDKSSNSMEDLGEEDMKTFDANVKRIEQIEQQLKRFQMNNDIENRIYNGTGRLTDPNGPDNTGSGNSDGSGAGSGIQNSGDKKIEPRAPSGPLNRKTMGFNNLGDFALAVRNHAMNRYTDNRLKVQMADPNTWAGETNDAGILVPPTFREEIYEQITQGDSFLEMTDSFEISGNTFTAPVSSETPWGSDGIQVYWMAEAGEKQQSRPHFDPRTVRTHKLAALIPVTDELLEDQNALDSFLRRKTPMKMLYAISRAIMLGTGVGQPKGLIDSGATLTVAPEGGQASASVVYQNIVNMDTVLNPECDANAVYFIHHTVKRQLMGMQFPTSAGTTAVPVYLPPNGLAERPFATLMGRRVIVTQACRPIGNRGDIVLADMSKYLTVMKAGQPKVDVSMHLWFDFDMQAFRFVFRIGGEPWWSQPVDDAEGTGQTSCFVVMGERP